MARPREFDTDQALAQIADTFWTKGYEATSLGDLEQATGLARPRLYAAFGAKRDMLHKSIDWYLNGPLERVFSQVDNSGIDGITNWFTMIAGLRKAEPEKATKGCLVVNSLVELANTDVGVSERGQAYRARLLAAFRSALETSDACGDIDGRIEERSNIALMLLLGMFVSIKGGNSADAVADLAESAISVVESWRVAPTKTPTASP